VTTPAPQPPSSPAEAGASLFVVQEGSSAQVALPEDGEIVIGSGATATLRIDQASVASEQLRLVCARGAVTALPLGAENDTLVNHEPLRAPRGLASGDVLRVGDATLVVRLSPCHSAGRLLPWPELRRRLDEEIERAVRYRRVFALVALDLGGAAIPEGSTIAEALLKTLRLCDVLGRDGGSGLLALLPETAEAVGPPAMRLLGALAPVAPRARAGFACCPSEASDRDALLATAREAAAGARPGELAGAPGAARRWVLGERAVVVADPSMKQLFGLVERLARSDLPVLVAGESGVGKELVAAALHAWSARKSARIVSLNCAAIPESLLESELFGHERGAFSGATGAKPGLLEVADGGTLFLDEIGECPPAQQAKLVRVLETKRLLRLGAVSERAIDVRIVAATNRSLEDDVAAGRFRRDLFFRLGAATVVVPPLRQRPLDLPVLARSFLDESCARLGRPSPAISAEVMVRLARHTWPGNVRELRNLFEYVAATAEGPTLELSHLPPSLAGAGVAAAGAQAPRAMRGGPRTFRNLHEEVRELERTRMAEALEACDGGRARAASLIGMPLRTFVTKLKEYGLGAAADGDGGAGKRGGG
jgi:two-component system response regulator AtoC